MKKLFLILTTALFAAGFASCTDDPEETVNPVASTFSRDSLNVSTRMPRN